MASNKYCIWDIFENLQTKYHQILESGIIDEVLEKGAKRASEIANETVKRVKKVVGLYTK